MKECLLIFNFSDSDETFNEAEIDLGHLGLWSFSENQKDWQSHMFFYATTCGE